MNAPGLLRAASVVAFLQFAGHTLLFVTASPQHGLAERAVVDAMRENRFAFGGSLRSYWDFYFGYGLEAAAICLVEAVLFWQLATVARSDPRATRPIVALFLVFNLGHVALALTYFFLTPIVPDLIIAGTLALAFMVAGRPIPHHRLA